MERRKSVRGPNISPVMASSSPLQTVSELLATSSPPLSTFSNTIPNSSPTATSASPSTYTTTTTSPATATTVSKSLHKSPSLASLLVPPKSPVISISTVTAVGSSSDTQCIDKSTSSALIAANSTSGPAATPPPSSSSYPSSKIHHVSSISEWMF